MKKITFSLVSLLLFATACGNPTPLQYADPAAVQEENALVTDTTEQKNNPVATATESWDTICTGAFQRVDTLAPKVNKAVPKAEPIIVPKPKEKEKVEVKTKPEPKANVSTSHTYIVQKGDTKYSISKRLAYPIEKLVISNPIWNKKGFVLTPGQTVYYWKTEK